MSLNTNLTRHGTGLCLLSLDAGGSRGVSQLKILAEMMHRLNFDAADDQIKRPSNVFDMIGGAGSGGFIAILLVVFGLTTNEALDELISLSINVLDKQGIDAPTRTATLNQHISNLMAKYKIKPESRLIGPINGSQKCKLVVPISYKSHVGSICMIRNFSTRREQTLDLTIAEALSVTLATPPLFTSISIFKDAANFEYIGADWTLSNPTQEIIAEAHGVFGAEERVACLLSLGCGHPGILSTPDSFDSTEWVQFLKNLAFDADRKAQSLDSQMGHLGLYSRFSVGGGLETVDLGNDPGPVNTIAHTTVYLQNGSVSQKMDLCMDMIRMREGTSSLDQLKRSGGRTILSPHLPPITKSFVMRTKHWEFIRQVVLGPCDPENNDGSRMLLVTGIGGCGKTQLMLKFMKMHQNEFSLQFFIDGSSEERIRADIIRNVQALGDAHSQKGFDECLAFLSQTSSNKPQLILYDNVDDPNLDLSPLLPEGDSCTVVITSRNRSLGDLYPESHLPLDIMAVDEAVSLLLYGHATVTERDQKDAEELAEVLGFLPIALQQAKSYMQQTKCSIRAYIERLSSSRHNLLAQSIKQQVNMREISTYAAFETSFSKLNTYAQDFLRLLSHFYRNGFPLELVALAAKHKFSHYVWGFLDNGDDFGFRKKILEDIFLRNGTWDIINLDQMVVSLQNYSLVTVVTGIDTSLLQLHPLVHDWLLSSASEVDLRNYHSASVLLLALGARDDHTAATQYLGSHVKHMTPFWDHITSNDAMAFGQILRNNGMFEDASHLQERVVTQATSSLGENNIVVSYILWELARTYRQYGRLSEAATLQQKILKISKESQGENHRNTLMAANNLAITYTDLGRLQEAEIIQTDVVKRMKQRFGVRYSDTIASSSSLAIIYYNLGRLKEAEMIQTEVLKLRREVLGERHPETISASSNLALTYRSLGRLEQAKTIQLQVLKSSKEVKGERHPDTVEAFHSLALTYRDQGELEEALVILERVLELRQEIQGKRHLDIILTSSDLAIVLQRLGRLDEAHSLSTEAVRLGDEIIGLRHDYVLQASCSLAAVYHDQGRLEEAETLQLKTLHLMREVLGERHFKTTEATLALANIYTSLRRKDTALDLIMTVEGIFSEDLRTEHPQYIECQRIKADALNIEGIHKEVAPQHEGATKDQSAFLDFDRGHKEGVDPVHDEAAKGQSALTPSKPQRRSHWYTRLMPRKHDKSRDL